MKLEHKIFLASIGCGVLFWLSSSLIAYYLFFTGGIFAFFGLLFKGIPEHGTYANLLILGLFAIFGYIMSKLVAKLQTSQKLLENEKERLSVTLQSIGDGVIVADTEGKITMLNKVAEKLTGWSEKDALGKSFKEVFITHDEKIEGNYCNLANGILDINKIVGPARYTMLISKDKSEYIITSSGEQIKDKNGNSVGMIIVFKDVTIDRKIDAEIQRIDKLESIRFLTSGIAHDFNNIMTSILGNISLALISKDISKIKQRLYNAEKSCIRARDLTKQLQIFSRGGVPIKETENISDFIKESVIFALSGSKVRADFQIYDDLLPIDIDKSLLNQIINDLAINAIKSMPNGGIIRIYAENCVIDSDSELQLKPNKYVKISFKDDSENIIEKPANLDLWLWELYAIVKNHSGHIAVDSESGTGMTFSLYLPTSSEKFPNRKKVTDSDLVYGKGKVLLMDDEKHVRDTVAEMLISIGYEVTTAINGFEAIQLYKQSLDDGQKYDMVILDLTIPGEMGGLETFQKLRQIDANVKSIITSAYLGDTVMANYSDYGFNGVLPKPYKINELSKILDKVIKGEQ